MASEGNRYSGEFAVLYEELRAVARKQLASERRGHTLRPTALVNEAFLRLSRAKTIPLNDRAHFLNIAARTMRQVLVDYARARVRAKRGCALERITLADVHLTQEPNVDLDALNEALTRLEGLDARQASIVDMRFFAGMSDQEIAGVLGVSAKTVQRDWAMARSWLNMQLRGAGSAP